MEDQSKIVTYRKLGDEYQIEVPGQPTGFASDREVLYRQLAHLQEQGFVLFEDKKNPVHLEDRLQ